MASKAKLKKIELIEEILGISFEGDVNNLEDVEAFIDEYYEYAMDEKEERESRYSESLHQIFSY